MIVKELFARLGLDIDTSGFEKANTLIGGVKAGLMVVGAALTAAAAGITHMVLETADAGREVYLLAQKTGMATGDLQELSYAAQRAGVGAEEAGIGLLHLTRHMNAARNGSDEQAKAFAKMGVRVADGSGKLRNAGDVLEDIAEKFKAMPDGADKTAAAMELFGKSGAQMIPLLNKGRDGIDALRASARELGVVLDEDAIEQSLALKSALGDLKVNTTALQYAIAVPLMGTVTQYVKALGEWIKSSREVTKQRVDKFVNLIKVALAIALPPLKLLAFLLGFVIDQWKVIAVILSSVVFAALVVNAAQVLAVAQGYIAAGAAGVAAGIRVAAAWVAANLPLIALTLIFAFIILLIDDVVTAMNGGKSVLKEWLGEWKDDNPGEAWWLRDLKSLAYLMLHMGPVFDFWKKEIQKLWDWMKDGFINVWDDIVVGVKSLFGIHDDRNDAKLRKKAHYAAGYTKPVPGMEGEWKENSQGEKLWYPTSDIDDAANARFAGLVKSGSGNTFKVVQHITPPAGTPPDAVADESVRKFNAWQAAELAKANAEF